MHRKPSGARAGSTPRPGRGYVWRSAAAVALSGGIAIALVAGSGWATAPASAPAGQEQASVPGLPDRAPVWTWANGQTLRPVSIQEGEAAQILLSELAPSAQSTRIPGTIFPGPVLADGTVLGTREGDTVSLRGGSVTTLDRSELWASLQTFDGTVYRTVMQGNDSLVQEVDPHGGLRTVATLPGALGAAPDLIHDGRAYWTQAVNPNGDAEPARNRVVSRALAGGPTRVEAYNAQSPVLTSEGIVIQSIGPVAPDAPEDFKITGLDLLTQAGGRRPLLSFHGFNDGVGIESVHMQTTGAGSLLTISSASTAGLLVIDLSTHRSWNIVREGKDLAVLVYNTGERVIWSWMAPFAHGQSTKLAGPAGMLLFEPGTGTLTLARGPQGASAVGAAGEKVAWFVPRPGAPLPSPGIGDGSDQPPGTVYVAEVRVP